MIWALVGIAGLAVGAGAALKDSSANQTLFLALNHLLALLPAPFWAGVTNLGSTVAALALLLALAPLSLQPLRLAVLAALPTTFLVHGLKQLTAEPRPAALLNAELFQVVDKVLKSGAFPSGHTATAVVCAGAVLAVLVPLKRRQPLLAWLGIVAFGLMALLVALSRIAVGAHWPSDLLGGLGVGLVGVAAALWLAPRLPSWHTLAAERWLLLIAFAATLALPFDDGLYPSGMAATWFVWAAALLGGSVAAWRHYHRAAAANV